MRVIITRHARQRHVQRTGREVDKHGLKAALRSRLMSGAKVTDGRIIFPAGHGLKAIAAPTASGWIVITFLTGEMTPLRRVKMQKRR